MTRPKLPGVPILRRDAASDAVSQAARPEPAASWGALLWRRLWKYWYLKSSGTALGIAGFFLAYFEVMRHPLRAPYVMPLTLVDHMIPVHPAAPWAYLSLWVYLSLAPALLVTRRELWTYAAATGGMCIVGLAVFVFWPTAVPPFDIDWSVYPTIAFLKSRDLALNACPSMHVAFAVFTAPWLARALRQMHAPRWLHVLNVAWCLAIVWSTIATRQHVFIDVVCGALLGGAIAALHLRAVPSQPGGSR